MRRAGAELLFQVFADRYERRSLLITSKRPLGEWGQVFQGERMRAALLDRLSHPCHLFERNGESDRFRESRKTQKDNDPRKGKPAELHPAGVSLLKPIMFPIPMPITNLPAGPAQRP